MIRVGVISDTHGLLRPEAVGALRGCDRILHAGDVGRPEVLDGLRALAPVRAVRGNVDRGPLAALPRYELIRIGDAWIYLHHGHEELDIDPEAAGVQAVIAGHSHRPADEERGGVRYLNPGSAGPRRFSLPVALAILDVDEAGLAWRPVTLAV